MLETHNQGKKWVGKNEETFKTRVEIKKSLFSEKPKLLTFLCV